VYIDEKRLNRGLIHYPQWFHRGIAKYTHPDSQVQSSILGDNEFLDRLQAFELY